MTPRPELVDRFRAAVERRLGLVFGADRQDEMATVLRDHARLADADLGRYVDAVDAGVPDVLRALAERLTVGETYFFRNAEQFRALMEVALPDRLCARGPLQPLRVLSAGCASGEEAYSLAILTRRAGLAHAVALEAFDVNPAAIARARAMRYSEWSLRETSTELREHAFRREGSQFVLDPALRDVVRFSERNLLDPSPALWPRAAWDVVFCRNVLMYFPAAAMAAVLDRIAGSLAPGGYLFLGHAESLRGVTKAFELRQSHGTFYYQRRDEGGGDSLAEGRAPGRSTPTPDADGAPSFRDASWVDTIRVASARIARLVDGGPSPHPESPAERPPERLPPARGAPDPTPVIELMRQERYHEALARIVALRADTHALSHRDDAELCLLHAVLLTHAGQLPAAEALCGRLLALDDQDAGVHYLLALCREQAGDLRGAVENDRASTWRDPVFAMPHLHLGLLARRAGDWDEAARELQIALALLAREDARRILLFGGGFGREALEGLCRAELRACGGGR